MYDYLAALSDEALIDELIPARDQIAEDGPYGYFIAVVNEIMARNLDYLLTEEDKENYR